MKTLVSKEKGLCKTTPGVLSLFTFLATSVAFSAEPRQLEEVTVTAQRIGESIQDVPISMIALTSDSLANANVFSFEETIALTPGVSAQAGLQSAAIRIRGVGERGFAVGTQSVQVYVDQIARAQPGSIFSTLVDIERIELLRGPQGTLYGANAAGGAYNISTKNPDFTGLGGYVQASYSQYDSSSSLDTVDFRGAVNVPLIDDKLALRVAGVYADSEGFVTVQNPQSRDDSAGGFENKSIRTKLLWQIQDKHQLILSYDYKDLTDTPLSFNYDGLVPGTGGGNPFPETYNSFDDRESYAEYVSEISGDLDQYILHWTSDFDFAQVDLIHSYEDWGSQSSENRNPYPGGDSLFEIGTFFNVSTTELRLSNSDEQISYIGGLYYVDREAKSDLEVRVGTVDISGDGDNTTESWAAFANVTFHLAEKWDLSLGARYDESDLDIDTNIGFLTFLGEVNEKQSYDDWSWSIKVRNYLSDSATAYIAIDHAYRQGGFNTLVAAAANDGFSTLFPDAYAIAQDELFYGPEDTTAFEIGVKGTAFDDRLQYGVAVFYQEFDDHQITQNDQGPSALAPVQSLFARSKTNAESVETKGIEFELRYLLAEHWDMSLSAAYADPDADEWSSRFCDPGEESTPDQVYCPLNNAPLTSFPKWTAFSDAGYRAPLGSGELFARINWSWQSEPNFTTVTDEFSEDKHRIGFNLGYDFANGFSVQVWGKNLTDEYLTVNPTFRENGDPALPGAFEGSFDRGREFGMTVQMVY